MWIGNTVTGRLREVGERAVRRGKVTEQSRADAGVFRAAHGQNAGCVYMQQTAISPD